MEKLNKIFLTIFIVFVVLGILSTSLYIGLYFFAPEKSVSFVLKGGLLQDVEELDKKYIFNFRYFRNSDNSGKEMFEMRLNYFTDEETNDIYSTGIQLISPNFIYEETLQETFVDRWYDRDFYFAPYFRYNIYEDSSYVLDSYIPEVIEKKDAINHCRFLYNKNFYVISVGEDLYKMTFKDEFETIGYKQFGLFQNPVRINKNFAYFLAHMYESIKFSSVGENQTMLFEFIDFFNFQKFDKETGVYGEILGSNTNEFSLVTKHLKQYFAVKIDCYDYGVTKASESLFNCVQGSFNYDTSGGNVSEDYFIGKTILNLNELDFEYKYDENNNFYYISLKDSVRKYLLMQEDIVLNILINQTYLNEFGLESFEVIKSKLNIDDLSIYKFIKYTTDSEGNVVTREVISV